MNLIICFAPQIKVNVLTQWLHWQLIYSMLKIWHHSKCIAKLTIFELNAKVLKTKVH